jgi:uncharacterized repeat protein (TIGR02543 family)
VFSYEKDSDDWETFKHEFSFTTLPYKVIFDANYTGAPSTSPSAIYATGANNTVETLPEEPTREGYTFLGWYPSDDGTGDRFTTSVSVPNDDYIVYAQWESITSPVSYTVTYDKNNTDANSTEANPLTQTVSQPATTVGTLPDPPTRAGYTFTGWNTAANGSGTAFTAATQVTANITVYAQWQQVTTPTNVYEITVTPASHTYPDLPTGYSSNSYWQDFVVENTGSNTVTSLSASFSSTVSGGTSKFNLDKAYKNISLAPGEKITIRVQPVSGLTANTYTDALIIKGDNGIDKVVTLTAAVVNAPTYRMTITPGTMIYNSAGIGYSNANMEQFFIISNNGSEELTQILYTMNNNYFEYSTPLTIESLKPGESARIGIRPLNALPVGTAPYTAVLTLRWANDGGTGVSAGLSFTVTGAPRYSLSVQAGQGGVITSGSGGQYAEGEAVNLSAVADVGYVFRRWSSSGGGVFGNAAGNNSTFIMPGGNTTVTAEFTPIGANGYTQYGDLNSDGTINNQDLVLILRYFAQPGININRTAADVNADGTINSADLVLLLRFFAQPGTVLGR